MKGGPGGQQNFVTTSNNTHHIEPLRPTVATPCHRSIIGVDVAGSTERTNVGRGALRDDMYELIEEAMVLGGIGNEYRDELMDRGDGVMAFVHPVDQVPKSLLINSVVPMLSRLLARHNDLHRSRTVRMRAVVHAGEVHNDGRGWYGEAVDLACRLLEAPELKRRFARIEADLILVVSDEFFKTIVRHGYDGIDGEEFEPAVRVRLGTESYRGWVCVPQAQDIPTQVVRPITELHNRRASRRGAT